LRHAKYLRKPIPACKGPQRSATRTARPGQYFDGHVVSQSDVAGRARKMDSDQSFGCAAVTAAAQCAAPAGKLGERQAAISSRTHGAASEGPGLRGLPQVDGPDRIRLGELRRRRPLEKQRRRREDRPIGNDVQRRPAGWRRGSAAGTGESARHFRGRDDREDADVRAWTRSRILRHADGPQDRPGSPEQRLPVLVPGHGNCEKHTVPNEGDAMSGANASPTRSASAIARSLEEGRSHQEINIITKKHISRRTFLRGMGVGLSLPLLESMVPAQTPLAKTAANPQIRLGLCFMPHGAVMANWTPAEEGALKLSPTLLALEPYKDQVVVISNLVHAMAGPQGPGDNGGDHTRCPAVFLNGVHPKRTD